MKKSYKTSITFLSVYFFISISTLLATNTVGKEMELKPRGEIWVVESWRPDITVKGHNILQGLFEYAVDKNASSTCLAASWEWTDGTTLKVKLRRGVHFHNGEPFNAQALKFNFDYQRQNNPGRGIQIYMRDLKDIQIIEPYTIRMILDKPYAVFVNTLGTMGSLGPTTGWVIGAPRYMEQVGWEEFLKHPVEFIRKCQINTDVVTLGLIAIF